MPQGTFKPGSQTGEPFTVAGSMNVSIKVGGTVSPGSGLVMHLDRYMNDSWDSAATLTIPDEDIVYSGNVNTKHRLRVTGTMAAGSQIDWQVS